MSLRIRIDDSGASSKLFNQYSWAALGNIGPLKRHWPFQAWGPYGELTAQEWEGFLSLLAEYEVVPVVAITACWVTAAGRLVPFPQQFPDAAAVLKTAWRSRQVVVANHGLTHCVIGQHRPRFWRANRRYHREFWPYLPAELHREHIQHSQSVLEDFFGQPIEIFVPPGNVWSWKTYQALRQTNVRQVMANQYMLDATQPMEGIEFIDDRDGWWVLHDRDLKLKGQPWLIHQLSTKKF